MKKAIKINLKLLMNRKEFYFSVTAMLVLIDVYKRQFLNRVFLNPSVY